MKNKNNYLADKIARVGSRRRAILSYKKNIKIVFGPFLKELLRRQKIKNYFTCMPDLGILEQ